MMPAAKLMGGNGPAPIGAGKPTSFIKPCSRNSRPTTMRRIPRICGEYLPRKPILNSPSLLLSAKPSPGLAAAPLGGSQVLLDHRHTVRRQEQLGFITGIEDHAIPFGQAQEKGRAAGPQ